MKLEPDVSAIVWPTEGQALVRAHTGDWNTSGHLYSKGNL